MTTAFARVRALLLLAALGGLLVYGCGRTSLDDGFASATGTGGVSGLGGGGGSGPGGTTMGLGGSNAPNPCGLTTCKAGTEVCCTRLNSTPPTQTCVSATAPNACNGGVSSACLSSANCGPGLACCGSVASLANISTSCQPASQCTGLTQAILCRTASECPASLPRCCVLLQGLGACAPPGGMCPAPR